MKKTFFLSAIILLISIATVKAQDGGGGGFQHQTVQQRVSNTMSKLTSLNLDAATTVKVDSIFTDFYTAQQTAMQNMMQSGGQVDRDAMRQKRQELADDRDTKLKAVLTDDQYNKWKNDIEPTLRPQRGGNKSS
jgi:protein CpxP